MPMLDLECPRCGVTLELDEGFAGGVCRCAACGTLMTVPANPALDRAETLTRPPRPDQPIAPPSADADTDAPRGERVAVRAATVFTTESGRRVHVPDEAAIPLARKRRMVRTTTAVVFLGVVFLIIAASVTGMLTVLQTRSDRSDPSADAVAATFGFDPDMNPYLLTRANVLGLPLAPRCVVVVDASTQSRPWLSLVNEALATGLTVASDDATRIALTYAADPEPIHLVDGLAPRTALTVTELVRFQAAVAPRGSADLSAAIESARSLDATQLVLITSRSPDALADSAALPGADRAGRIEVVVIDGDDSAWRSVLPEGRGRVVSMSSNQLRRWREEARGAHDDEATNDGDIGTIR